MITSARTTKQLNITAFGTQTVYNPKQGMYVIVYFTFQGKNSNVVGGVDPVILRLRDSRSNIYVFTSDLNYHETNDLALFAEKKGLLSLCTWNNPEIKELLQVYDVKADATGIQLEFIDSSGAVQVQVDLGL